LRAGDRLLIKVWVDTVFADSVRIDGAGVAILPRVGAISVAGVRSDAIADSVRRVYARFIRTAAVEVTPLRRITVLGEVKRPATYYVETASTLRDAVAIAGGISDIGATGHAIVYREPGDRIRFEQWEQRRDSAAVVHSGDVVWIDREPWLKRNIFSLVSGLGLVLSLLYTARR
jgi:polysaccharide export outer membrane protein